MTIAALFLTFGLILMCVAFIISILDNVTPRTGWFVGILMALFALGFVLVLAGLDPLIRRLL